MNDTSNSTIFSAASAGNLQRVNELLSQDVKLSSTPDSNGKLALHYALRLPAIYTKDQKNNKIAIAKILIEKASTTLSHQDDAGDSPLHLMAASDEFDDLLVEAIQLNPELAMIANNASEYPIHVAIANQQIAATKALLGVSKVIHLVDAGGDSLLHHAVKANNLTLVKELIHDYHLNVNAFNEELHTPLDVATLFHFGEIVNYLQSHGGQQSVLSENNMLQS